MMTDTARQAMIAANEQEYGRYYEFLRFPSPEEAAAAEAERAALLEWLAAHGEIGCGGTKVDCRRLSPGCRTCADGGWSCLFINGRCNADCFYCPTSQDETGDPLTNGIPFASPEDYAEYVARFGFSGVSISGGEPLLTPERTLAYLTAVRRRCGAGVHLWLYTNGILMTGEIARELRLAGLDEIRFDIGATRYNLSKLSLAVGVIPTVTVEIPAIPEDEALMGEKLAEMATVGVQHLNLHQLRLTPHNFRHLVNRDYTFIHGEKITVLESELTALRLTRLAIETGIDLPMNYCSFPYKRRYQHAAARRRGIDLVRSPAETVTAASYLRSPVAGSPRYFEAVTLPVASGRHPAAEIPLPSGRKIMVEKRELPPPDPSSDSNRFEEIPAGLPPYF